jgi:hypothetical protein
MQPYLIEMVHVEARTKFTQLKDRLVHNGCKIPRQNIKLTSPGCMCANQQMLGELVEHIIKVEHVVLP